MDSDKIVSVPRLLEALNIYRCGFEMVFDSGRLVEYDSPKALLQKEKSLLRALVDESTDNVFLHGMADGGETANPGLARTGQSNH